MRLLVIVSKRFEPRRQGLPFPARTRAGAQLQVSILPEIQGESRNSIVEIGRARFQLEILRGPEVTEMPQGPCSTSSQPRTRLSDSDLYPHPARE